MNELITKNSEWIIHFMRQPWPRWTASSTWQLITARLWAENGSSPTKCRHAWKWAVGRFRTTATRGGYPTSRLGGKIRLYRESDIERMLSDSYRPAYRLTGTWFFLGRGAKFAVCPQFAAAIVHPTKTKKEQLTDEASKSASSVSRYAFFSFLRFPSVACFRYRMLVQCVAGSGKVFRWIRSNPFEEDSARNGACRQTLRLPPKPALPLHPCIGTEWLAGWTSVIPGFCLCLK